MRGALRGFARLYYQANQRAWAEYFRLVEIEEERRRQEAEEIRQKLGVEEEVGQLEGGEEE